MRDEGSDVLVYSDTLGPTVAIITLAGLLLLGCVVWSVYCRVLLRQVKASTGLTNELLNYVLWRVMTDRSWHVPAK